MLNMRACPRESLRKDIGNKKIVCFGAGRYFDIFLKNNEEIRDKIFCILDNNLDKDKTIKGKIPIYSIETFVRQNDKNIVIIITSSLHYRSIIDQLDQIDFFDGIDCYIDTWNKNKLKSNEFYFLKGEQKIPKIIHYCWFGKQKIPDYLEKCIDTWKKYCPDYEIVRWNEDNYDIRKNRYMFQAYETKKYGFVPDYARLDIINQYGGIYLDTDVELIRNLDDLLCYEFYCGFEDMHYIALGLGFGAVKGHPLLNKMLDTYTELEFVKNGIINSVASPQYQSKVIEKEGFVLDGMYQEKNGVGIFPYNVLAPGGSLLLPDEVTKNTFSIHHYDASWMDGRDEIQRRRRDLRLLYMERVLKN